MTDKNEEMYEQFCDCIEAKDEEGALKVLKNGMPLNIHPDKKDDSQYFCVLSCSLNSKNTKLWDYIFNERKDELETLKGKNYFHILDEVLTDSNFSPQYVKKYLDYFHQNGFNLSWKNNDDENILVNFMEHLSVNLIDDKRMKMMLEKLELINQYSDLKYESRMQEMHYVFENYDTHLTRYLRQKSSHFLPFEIVEFIKEDADLSDSDYEESLLKNITKYCLKRYSNDEIQELGQCAKLNLINENAEFSNKLVSKLELEVISKRIAQKDNSMKKKKPKML